MKKSLKTGIHDDYENKSELKNILGVNIMKRRKRKNEIGSNHLNHDLGPESEENGKQFIKLKKQIKKSKLICKKCKIRLLSKNNKNQKLFSNLDFKNELIQMEPIIKNKNIVYQNYQILYEVQQNSLEMMREYISEFPVKKFKIKIKKTNKLFNLFKILKQILFDKLPTQSDISKLTNVEQNLLLLVVKKKKFYDYENAEISLQYFQKLINNPVPKRPEENMKLIIKSSFKTIKHYFEELCYNKLKSTMYPKYYTHKVLSVFDYAFHGYYFGDTSVKINQSIEKFFYPRKIISPFDTSAKLISKTISKLYLNLIGMSQLFVHDLFYFLDNYFLVDFKFNLLKKIQKLCMDWSSKLEKESSENVLKDIQESFRKNPKIKLFWTIGEVTLAINQVKGFLNNQSVKT